MFLEVYSEQERDKLLQCGYKLMKTVPHTDGLRYIFVNKGELKFDKSEVRARITNALTF